MMMFKETVLNKHAENLIKYIEKYKIKFEERLINYNAVGQLNWDDKSWFFGEKGVAWLKETKDRGFKWDEVSKRIKGLTKMSISPEFQDFMKAYHMSLVCASGGLPSGSTLEKPLQVMKRWYWEMVKITGQTHPMYLTSDIIYAAMDRHYQHSESSNNVSDYCDVAVKCIMLLRQYNLFLVNIEVKNKYSCRNSSNNTKARKNAEHADPERTNDEKLISIRAFISIIELIALAENNYQRIFYNMLLLLIICGFRFQEIMLLEINSLVKREITDKDKRQHAIDKGWPTYKLGIEYLGAKKSGWRVHWLAPCTYPVIEMIYKSVKELTSPFRQTIKGFRESNFTNMLPQKITELPDDWIEQSELKDIMFSGTGGARNDFGKSIRTSIENFSGHKPKIIPTHKQKNSWYFTKGQLNDYVFQRYAKSKNFEAEHRCIISAKNNGDWEHFNYEDLMFIMPEGAFGISTNFVSLQHIVPLDDSSVEAWLGGIGNRKSIFKHFNLFEDDGSYVSIKKHVPRHNINTFLAIAGVTDHIQAILMGRVDITQNRYYQHQAESQSYQTASLAINMLEKTYDDKKNPLIYDSSQQKPSGLIVEEKMIELKHRMAALYRTTKKIKNTGVANVKSSASIMVNPNLSMENNLKQNMQTFGETSAEVAHYIASAMSDNFLPELKHAHDKLIQQNLTDNAKSLLERHAKLHPLVFGACTRDVARWGCPHALKCQSGLPCGYFSLTGRLGEADEISRRLTIKKEEVIQLRKLAEDNSSFRLALKEQEEALIILETLETAAIENKKAKKLVSLLSNDSGNPLVRVISRINEQMLIGKKPKTLADLFFIEQKRIERNSNG